MPPAEVKDERAVQLGEWVSAWRRKRGLNRPETVNEALKYDPRAKLSPDYLSKIEYGKRSLASASPEVREALRLALNITKETWENETGLLVPAAVIEMAPISSGPSITPAPPQRRDDVSPITNVYKIPVIGMAAAGYGVDLTEVEPIAYDYVDPVNYREGMIILQVDGDSMEASGEVNSLHAGDWIYVDPRALDLQDNKIYVVYIPDRGVLVKRVRKWPQGWMLTSDNNEYPPFAADEANVIGRVYYRQPKGERL